MCGMPGWRCRRGFLLFVDLRAGSARCRSVMTLRPTKFLELRLGKPFFVAVSYRGIGGPWLAAPARMAPFHEISLLHDGLIVQLRRSAQRFEGAQELHQERLVLAGKLNSIGRTGRGLL